MTDELHDIILLTRHAYYINAKVLMLQELPICSCFFFSVGLIIKFLVS